MRRGGKLQIKRTVCKKIVIQVPKEIQGSYCVLLQSGPEKQFTCIMSGYKCHVYNTRNIYEVGKLTTPSNLISNENKKPPNQAYSMTRINFFSDQTLVYGSEKRIKTSPQVTISKRGSYRISTLLLYIFSNQNRGEVFVV